jgi:hypothetical protein
MRYLTETYKYNIFWISIISIHILYIFTFLGIIFLNKNYIRSFSILVQTIICILLLLRFNPFTTHEVTQFDKSMIFSSASFLAFNLLFTEIYTNYIEKSSLYSAFKDVENIVIDQIK